MVVVFKNGKAARFSMESFETKTNRRRLTGAYSDLSLIHISSENQTKKAITNKFIQEAMTEFLKEGLEIYFIENKAEADKIAEQILINKRSREQAEKARLNIKKKLSGNIDLANRVQKFVDCRTKDASRRELYICLLYTSRCV